MRQSKAFEEALIDELGDNRTLSIAELSVNAHAIPSMQSDDDEEDEDVDEDDDEEDDEDEDEDDEDDEDEEEDVDDEEAGAPLASRTQSD